LLLITVVFAEPPPENTIDDPNDPSSTSLITINQVVSGDFGSFGSGLFKIKLVSGRTYEITIAPSNLMVIFDLDFNILSPDNPAPSPKITWTPSVTDLFYIVTMGGSSGSSQYSLTVVDVTACSAACTGILN